jgi:hypothetical protein
MATRPLAAGRLGDPRREADTFYPCKPDIFEVTYER